MRIRLLVGSVMLALLGVLMGVFAVNGALEGRGRDATEGGIPAAIMVVAAALLGRHLLRQMRR